jgi:hypothetical protein
MKRRRVVSTISHASRVQYNQQGVLTKGKIAEFDFFFRKFRGRIFSPTYSNMGNSGKATRI